MPGATEKVFVLSVALAILLGASGCRQKPEEREAQLVRVAIVGEQMPQNQDRYSATVLPSAQVDLTFRVGGYVRTIHQIKDASGRTRELEVGDQVPAGMELAAIRPVDYQAHADSLKSQLNQAQSSRLTAQAQLEEAVAAKNQAQLTFDRAKTLFAAEAMTKPEFDDARLGLDRAEARVAACRSQVAGQQSHIEDVTANLKEADSALGDTRLIAPFAGVIVARKIEMGSLAEPGAVAFVIANIENVKVAFGVPDVALNIFRVRKELPVTTESAPGAVFRGRVSSISSSANTSDRAFTVELSVPNPSGVLKAGMIALVELNGAMPGRAPLEVPLSAVVHTAGMKGYGVFVLESRNGRTTAQLRDISLGHMDGKHVVVAGGLAPGEHVAEDGGLQLVSGELVREIR